MGTALVRYTDTNSTDSVWGVLRDEQVFPLALSGEHHKDIMKIYFSDRAKFDAAVSEDSIAESEVEFQAPISRHVQLFLQGMNYASHRKEGGLFHDEDKEDEHDENSIFYKASSSISKPNETILRPNNCQLLDYEIELGLVMKKPLHQPTAVTENNLGEYIGGIFLANDVSARDFMFGAPAMQWFKGKSQRTFCPAGPVLYLLDGDDIKKIYDLELKLYLNGKLKQDSVTEQMIHKPPKTLSELSVFTMVEAGDCILTGTPGGVLMNLNLKTALAILLNMKNDYNRRKKLISAQLARAEFLKPGDLLELEIKSRCGSINLGRQQNLIADA